MSNVSLHTPVQPYSAYQLRCGTDTKDRKRSARLGLAHQPEAFGRGAARRHDVRCADDSAASADAAAATTKDGVALRLRKEVDNRSATERRGESQSLRSARAALDAFSCVENLSEVDQLVDASATGRLPSA